MRIKHWFFIVIAALVLSFLFVERAILPPFVLAAIFAYIFNPIVNFISKKLHLPRTVGVIGIYSLILTIVVTVGFILARQITDESADLNHVVTSLLSTTAHQVTTLPDWMQPVTRDLLVSLRRTHFFYLGSADALPFFSKALTRVISFFIFLFSGFYFLKDGENFTNKILSIVPHTYKSEVSVLIGKINTVLSGYLRGQMFLVFLVACMLYIALSILGVRFALIIALFSGFAEIVPVVGPITAGAVAVLVVLLTGTANFGLAPMNAALIVIIVYFVFRQLEDYLITPHVMERITKLPPFIIFFAVIAGGHLAGILGLILAVPIAAVLRLLLEYSLDKVSSVKVS